MDEREGEEDLESSDAVAVYVANGIQGRKRGLSLAMQRAGPS